MDVEPPHAEDILKMMVDYPQDIPIQVIRGGKPVIRTLDRCRPREVLWYAYRCVHGGHDPLVTIR